MPPDQDDHREFDRTDQAAIWALLRVADADLQCPRCGGQLELGRPLVGGTAGEYWDVACRRCGRHTIAGVKQVPRDRRPEP